MAMYKPRRGTGHPTRNISELEDEIKILNDIIDSDRKEAEDIFNKLQVENDELKMEIKSLLKCHECDEIFESKTSMKTHILSDHSVKGVKCRNCIECFDTNVHKKKHLTEKNVLLSKQDELRSKLSSQKIKAAESVYKLKQNELKLKSKCLCKGICKIAHSKFRWTKSNADAYFATLKKINTFNNQLFTCQNCNESFPKEDVLNEHLATDHQARVSVKCQHCSETFNKEADVDSHTKAVHLQVSEE